MKYEDITSKIIQAYYNVFNKLGYGFLEKVYENSMLIELRGLGLYCEAQRPIKVYYGGALVGYYFADIVVEGNIIVELKAAESLCEEHEAQLLNYLRATDIEIGLLFNFGQKPQFRRKIFENKLKQFNQSVVIR